MRRTVGIIVVLVMAAGVCFGAESDVLHPEWGWRETGCFLGQMVGVSGMLVSTVYVVVPVLMDMYWYATGPTTWDAFWTSLGEASLQQPGDAGIALVCDVLFLGVTVISSMVLSTPASGHPIVAGPGALTISVLGARVGIIQPGP